MVVSAALALALLGVYAALAPHAAADGDSAELTAVLATLGVAHPTGYPIYTLLGHPFVVALRALGADPAYAANLWGAVGGAVALCFVHRLALRLVSGETRVSGRVAFAIAALPTLALAFNPQWIAECTLVEVYSWHVAWLAGAALMFIGDLQALEDRSRPVPLTWRMLAWGFVCGIGGAHHRMAVFYAAAMTVALTWALVRAGRFRWHVPLLWLASGLVPMSTYAYLYLRARHPDSASVWPGLEPTVHGLWAHVSGAIYTGFLGSWRPSADAASALAHDVYPWVWPGLAALAVMARVGDAKDRLPFGALFAGSAVQLAFVYRYGVADPVSYFMAPLMTAVLGIAALAAVAATRWRPAAARAITAAGAVVVAAFAAYGVREAIVRRHDVMHYDEVIRSMWKAVPDEPSIFLWASDDYYKVELYQRFEGDKPSVAVYNTAMLCQTLQEHRFQARFGFDPLANNGPEHAREPIPPKFIPEHHVLLDDRFLGRVNETIADSARVPVLMFNSSAMRLRRLN